jgi:hypothetical protein
MNEPQKMDRRAFLSRVTVRGAGLGIAGATLPALLAACGDDPTIPGGAPPGAGGDAEGAPIVGDVLDFALSSDEWEGAFGFVDLRLHQASVDGGDAFFIRLDASDEAFAADQGHVFVPKIAGMAGAGLTGDAYLLDDGSTVLSSDPTRPDYTPAWRIHRVRPSSDGAMLGSIAAILDAERRGEAEVETTDIVTNWPVVKWPDGELPVDGELKEYLGGGQLIEAPDVGSMSVRFKLHECFPDSRYIVCDTSLPPMAQGMNIAASPRLGDGSGTATTGRVNVFMNGIDGSGPMGFQPSVFDSTAGDPEWSPYWDHRTYAWTDGTTPRVLTTQSDVEEARDRGDLDEFPGTPDTGGQIFTVNCPVPVLAPNTFEG